MGATKHLMDEVAARMEIDDPNDPRVLAEVNRLLSTRQRRTTVMPDREELTMNKAEEIAGQRYGREFNDLPNGLQYQVFSEAEQAVVDDLATQADLRLDGQKERRWDELELQRRLGK